MLPISAIHLTDETSTVIFINRTILSRSTPDSTMVYLIQITSWKVSSVLHCQLLAAGNGKKPLNDLTPRGHHKVSYDVKLLPVIIAPKISQQIDI